jgi:hypothetical protein
VSFVALYIVQNVFDQQVVGAAERVAGVP